MELRLGAGLGLSCDPKLGGQNIRARQLRADSGTPLGLVLSIWAVGALLRLSCALVFLRSATKNVRFWSEVSIYVRKGAPDACFSGLEWLVLSFFAPEGMNLGS